MRRAFALFASTAPGLEPIAEAELRALGALDTRVVPGGVELKADRERTMRLLVELRTVSHLLVRVGTFRADRFERLEREIGKLDWSAWLVPGVPRRVRATAEKSRLFHTGAITERVSKWIAQALGEQEHAEPEAAEGAGVTVALRLVHDEATVSIDLSGEPLHRRGYRLDPGKAPLREDLAAALLMASGWDRACPLIDPMCGSGTIAIEAALLATHTAPGIARAFAITETRLGNQADLERARRAARAEQTSPGPRIVASDRDPQAVQRARANAERAGVTLELDTRALSELPADAFAGAGAFVVTNPPWGERLDEAGAGLDRLHAAIGALVKRLGPGVGLALIAHDARIARSVGLPLRTAFLTDAGGIKVRALVSPTPR